MINRVAVGAVALAGTFALGACGTATDAAAPPPGPTQASTTAPGATRSATAHPTTASAAGDKGSTGTPRCSTSDLKLEVGKPTESTESPGQYEVDLTYRNTSADTCALHGVPGVDLEGPDDPNGPVYHLIRVDNGVKYNEVPAGSAASASITFLVGGDGSTSSGGSTGWTPTTIVTTPPGQTTQLRAPWPSGFSVLRQDAATHPGTFVNGILGTTS